MGRGRAKAKQQKVARELKYNNQFTDLDALQRELAGSPSAVTHTVEDLDGIDDEDDDEFLDDEDEDDEDWPAAQP